MGDIEAKAAELKSILGADSPSVHALVPFVKVCDGDVAQAAAKVKASNLARQEYGQLTIADVSEFYRAPAGHAHPHGVMVPLEDLKGGVHRDNLGRPIVLAIGMLHGDAAEMQKQYAYVNELLEAHKQPDGPRGACTVIEVRPRDSGAPPTFRFPDRDCRTLMDMGRDIYPEQAYADLDSNPGPANSSLVCYSRVRAPCTEQGCYTTTHFCGLPRAVTWAFKLVRPFMRREAFEAMVLKPSFAHLRGAIPKTSLLRQWGGELDFDIDEWVEWRATQEGVPQQRLCPRRQGRAFDPAAVAAASEDAMADSLKVGASLSARALLAGEVGGSGAPPAMHGAVEKRGSGRGMFGSVRWKPKLLAASAELGLVYFDGLGATDENKAARIVPLGEPGTAVARRTSETATRPHQFALVVSSREYLFAASTAEQADQWVAALEAEIEAAAKMRLEMVSSGLSVDATVSTLEAVSLE